MYKICSPALDQMISLTKISIHIIFLVSEELNKNLKLQAEQQSQELASYGVGTLNGANLDIDPGGSTQEQDSPVDIRGFINGFIQDNYGMIWLLFIPTQCFAEGI